MTTRRPFWCLVLLLGASGGPPPSGDPSIPLRSYFRDLRTVQARTPQGDTLTLLFDTGGGATLLTPEAASRIRCRPYGRDVGFRMSGERVEFQRCDSVSLDFGEWSRAVRPVAVFDVNALLPKELPRVDGVLALDAFEGYLLTLDWPANRITVHPQGAAPGVRILATRTASGDNGRFLTVMAEARALRGSLWLLLDSGNLIGTLIDNHVLRDSLLTVDADSLARLRLGNLTFVTRAHRGDYIVDGALGTEFLRLGAVTLDLRNR